MITAVMFGMVRVPLSLRCHRLTVLQLIWALVTASGAGAIISSGPKVEGPIFSWSMLYGLSAIIGAYVSGCLGQSGKLALFLQNP